jgi:TetR/AcrR family transcriptional regulator
LCVNFLCSEKITNQGIQTMNKKNDETSSTELKIFEAARDVFQSKGLEGARMQEIADKAEINKSLLHYYYRSKDKLFEKVYQLSIIRVLPQIVSLLNEDLPLENKLRNFIDKYLEIIIANPDIPLFILHELNKNPNRLKTFMLNEVGKKVRPFLDQLREEARMGNTVDLPAEQILVNMMSMIIFPFIGKPVFQVIFEMDDEAFGQFISERKKILPDFIVQTVMKKS